MAISNTRRQNRTINLWYTPYCREVKKEVVKALKLFHWLGGEKLREQYIQLRKSYLESVSNAKRE